MIDWLIFLGYLAGFLYAWWYIAPIGAESMLVRDEEPGLGDRLFGSFMGMGAGLFWPIALLILFVAQKPRTTERSRRLQIEVQKRRIEQLERELGVKA